MITYTFLRLFPTLYNQSFITFPPFFFFFLTRENLHRFSLSHLNSHGRNYKNMWSLLLSSVTFSSLNLSLFLAALLENMFYFLCLVLFILSCFIKIKLKGQIINLSFYLPPPYLKIWKHILLHDEFLHLFVVTVLFETVSIIPTTKPVFFLCFDRKTWTTHLAPCCVHPTASYTPKLSLNLKGKKKWKRKWKASTRLMKPGVFHWSTQTDTVGSGERRRGLNEQTLCVILAVTPLQASLV